MANKNPKVRCIPPQIWRSAKHQVLSAFTGDFNNKFSKRTNPTKSNSFNKTYKTVLCHIDKICKICRNCLHLWNYKYVHLVSGFWYIESLAMVWLYIWRKYRIKYTKYRNPWTLFKKVLIVGTTLSLCSDLVRVVQTLDSAIPRINHYPADN